MAKDPSRIELTHEGSALSQWLIDKLLQERTHVEIRHQALLQEFDEQLKTLQTRARTFEDVECASPPNPTQNVPDPTQSQIAESTKEEGIGDGIMAYAQGLTKQLQDKIKKRSFVNRGSVSSLDSQSPWAPLAKFVTGNQFEVFFAVVISCNMIVLAFHTQYDGLDVGHDLGYHHYSAPANDIWRGGDFVFPMLDWAFGILYLIEVILKIAVLGRHFLIFMNCLDLFVVCVWVMEKLFEEEFSFRPLILRLIRVARVLRLVRLVHRVAGLEEMFLMVTALQNSVDMLLWSMVLLFVSLCIFVFFLNQMLFSVCMENNEVSLGTRHECFQYFGTFSRSIFSMFELTLGNYVPLSRFLMEEVSEYFVIFCIVYKLTLGFAVVAVINACFIKETFKTVATNRHIMVIEKSNERAGFQREIQSLLAHTDESHDGKLTKEEFAEMSLDPDVNTWLSALGLDASDSDKLFNMIDDGSGEVTADELFRGIVKLKGSARSLDLIAMASQQDKLKLQLQSIDQTMKGLMTEIGSLAGSAALNGPQQPPRLMPRVMIF